MGLLYLFLLLTSWILIFVSRWWKRNIEWEKIFASCFCFVCSKVLAAGSAFLASGSCRVWVCALVLLWSSAPQCSHLHKSSAPAAGGASPDQGFCSILLLSGTYWPAVLAEHFCSGVPPVGHFNPRGWILVNPSSGTLPWLLSFGRPSLCPLSEDLDLSPGVLGEWGHFLAFSVPPLGLFVSTYLTCLYYSEFSVPSTLSEQFVRVLLKQTRGISIKIPTS